jgi:hypothetical protein
MVCVRKTHFDGSNYITLFVLFDSFVYLSVAKTKAYAPVYIKRDHIRNHDLVCYY